MLLSMSWWSVRDRGWRFLLGAISVFFLALFLHFREVRLELLELNTTSDRYIVAQIDFEFPDYEETVVSKQRAMQEVGVIDQIDQKQLQRVRAEGERAFILAKKSSQKCSFEDVYQAIGSIASQMSLARFSDARTVQIAKESSADRIFYEKPFEEGDVFPPSFFEKVTEGMVGKYSAEAINCAVQVFSKTIWNLKQDVALERMLRSEISKTVPEKYSRVQAGERLIDPGEKVTSRHITMLQAMKQGISDSRKLWEPLPMSASLILSFTFVSISALYFFYRQPKFIHSIQQISLFISVIFITLFLAKCTEYCLVRSTNSIIERINYPIIAPFATFIICVLISQRLALFTAVFLSIICSVSLAVDHSKFLILNLLASLIVIICTRNVRKRKEIFAVFAKVALGSIPLLYVYTLSENHFWRASLLVDVGSSFFFLLVSAILAAGLLPVFESLFRILTEMTLMEYLDSSNVLLQRLALEVPGTYQHSLVVAHLSESCAAEIGANALLCRATALYHDIGKLINPQFYTENQQMSVDMHQLLSPEESAQIIISHVTDGEILARKHRLPQAFVDAIRQHHGTTVVYYFYCKEKELKGDVNEAQFCYPGPKPQTKEAAILMICDSIEAASRSLEEITERTLGELVERLVSDKAREGQFDECNLTFEELSRVKNKLIKTLCATQHVRIKYPQKNYISTN